MESKHTQTPYYICDEYNGYIPIDAPPSSTGEDESIEICLVSNQDLDGNIQKANAEFIIKACNSYYEMLEALESLEKVIDFYAEDVSDETKEAFQNALLAITKAKGK